MSSRKSISMVTSSHRHKSFSSSQPPTFLSSITANLSGSGSNLIGSSPSSSFNNGSMNTTTNSSTSTAVITQSGVASIGDNKNGKSCAYVNVIFPRPFAKQPIVHGQVLIDQLTITSSSQAVVKEVSNTYAVTILSTTTTGFCCVVRRVSKKMNLKPWVSNIKLQWFATLPSFCSGRTVVGIPTTGHSQGNSPQIGSQSDTIMVATTAPTGGSSMTPQNNPNNMVYLMSVTINLPPIPTNWNSTANASSTSHGTRSHSVYVSSGDLHSYDQQMQQQTNVSVPESPTVSTNLMYSHTPTLIPSHPPVVIVTPHASDGNSDDTFVASVREIYPNRFVAVIRRVGFENMAKPWSQSVKLNWTVFYNSPQIPNPFGKDCIIKAGVLPVGQNISSDDYVDREIRFMQQDIPSIPGNDFGMPRMVICTPRCDPQMPSNDIHALSIKTISPYGFSVNLRHIDSKTWHQNLYICYMAFYKIKRRSKKNEPATPPPTTKKTKNTGSQNLVPYNSQVYIRNCTNGFVVQANLNDHSVMITSEKAFLLSQDQRFIFRESGFIELATNCDYVLECVSLEDGADIVVSEKRETDNATQKWLVFQPVNPLTSDSVCIANVGNLNLVLDCENVRSSSPFLSTLNMTVSGSNNNLSAFNDSAENSHDQTLQIKDKSKTQQWKFTTVQENNL
ncbi:hypothetical protein FDP41_009396 [Naegleria fowleri]|uniref:Uncharacterized protein n=1 Tax=Naegleria fowleri TaxID=5763 RepID=A0A6A5AY21_NAEFO|nr:uncharacterized protein FDP41_009396 [Naegleria fowleri]KAF0972493.1 hypothetical protein FDP41_009396 [Naegleria fowleri]